LKIKRAISGPAASVGFLCLAASLPLFAQTGTGQANTKSAPDDAGAIPPSENDAMQQAYKDYSQKNFSAAASELKAILKRAPNITEAHEMLSNVYLEQNQIPAAIPELEAVVRLNPKDVATRNNLGVAYFQTGDAVKAAGVFQALSSQYPTNAAYTFQYALALEKEGKHADAAAYFEKAGTLNPKDSQAALYAGLLYHETGNDAKAVPYLKSALALGTSQKGSAYTALAEAATTAKQSGEAIGYQTQAALANPTDFGTEYNLGVLEQNAGRKADAEATYRQALTLKTDDPKAYTDAQINLAVLLSNDGKSEEAAALLTQSVQANPKNADLQADLGIVDEKQGKKALALAAFQQALILDPNNSQAKRGLARLNKP
jgi:tetratricopeptide (TPR) repeat protein